MGTGERRCHRPLATATPVTPTHHLRGGISFGAVLCQQTEILSMHQALPLARPIESGFQLGRRHCREAKRPGVLCDQTRHESHNNY